MSTLQNNPEKITSTFRNGNKPKGTNSYIVKEAEVTSTSIKPVPTALRTSLPLNGVDVIGQRLTIEGGGPVKINKGDFLRIYNRHTGATSHYLLGIGNDVRFYNTRVSDNELIKEISEAEKISAEQIQPA
ncbi:MAG TPA: hypothetical protein DEA55_07900 [Rhodospirillaceae bacterium]|nr:hypothetical protein [Rhodospirillaceae bacterium]